MSTRMNGGPGFRTLAPSVDSVQDPTRSSSTGGLPLKFAIALGPDALAGAFRLVHDQYVSRGYMLPDPSGLRVGLHHTLPTTKVFVATLGPRVVGTMTLIEDSVLGLPMDELYRDDLAHFRDQGRRVNEVS